MKPRRRHARRPELLVRPDVSCEKGEVAGQSDGHRVLKQGDARSKVRCHAEEGFGLYRARAGSLIGFVLSTGIRSGFAVSNSSLTSSSMSQL